MVQEICRAADDAALLLSGIRVRQKSPQSNSPRPASVREGKQAVNSAVVLDGQGLGDGWRELGNLAVPG
jgi:hypothetical protein